MMELLPPAQLTHVSVDHVQSDEKMLTVTIKLPNGHRIGLESMFGEDRYDKVNRLLSLADAVCRLNAQAPRHDIPGLPQLPGELCIGQLALLRTTVGGVYRIVGVGPMMGVATYPLGRYVHAYVSDRAVPGFPDGVIITTQKSILFVYSEDYECPKDPLTDPAPVDQTPPQ